MEVHKKSHASEIARPEAIGDPDVSAGRRESAERAERAIKGVVVSGCRPGLNAESRREGCMPERPSRGTADGPSGNLKLISRRPPSVTELVFRSKTKL